MASGRDVEGEQSLRIGGGHLDRIPVHPDLPAGVVEGQVAGSEGDRGIDLDDGL